MAVYSTDIGFINANREKALTDISERYKKMANQEAFKELGEIIENLNDSNNKRDNDTLIEVRDFISFWEDKLKLLVREGRDVIAEQTPNRSIYSVWAEECGSIVRSFILCESGRTNQGPCLKPIYKTPSLSPVYSFNDNIVNSDLYMVHNQLSLYLENQKNEEFTRLSKDVINKLHYDMDNDPDKKSNEDRFIAAWERFFEFLDNYKKNNMGSVTIAKVDEKPKENKQTLTKVLSQDEDIYDF